MIDIHASSLDSDCELRQAITNAPQLFEDWQLNTLYFHVGAVVGTAVHAAVHHLAVLGDPDPDFSVAHSIALGAMDAEIAESPDHVIQYDPVTPDRKTAEAQLGSMVQLYWRLVGRKHRWTHAEYKMRVPLERQRGFFLVGSLDGFTQDSWLPDTKTGKQDRPHPMQLSAYSWLLSETTGMIPKRLSHVFLKREVDGPRPAIFDYNIEQVETLAWNRINATVDRLAEFINDGDPGIFRANPDSDLCSRRFCSAFDTELCPASQIKNLFNKR